MSITIDIPNTIWGIIVFFLLGITGFLFYVLVSILKNADKIDYWKALLSIFDWNKRRKERNKIGGEINFKINTLQKKMNAEVTGILPYGIKIEWLDDKTIREAFLSNEKQVLIKLGHHENQDKNIVDATMLYIPQAVIPKTRNYIDKEIVQSIDLNIARTLLLKGELKSSVSYFLENIYKPLTDSNQGIQQYCDIMTKLDDNGIFTRVMLREFMELGFKIYGLTPSLEFVNESRDFIEYLKNFAERKPGGRIALDFLGNKIKCAIVLISKLRTIKTYGYQRYLKPVDIAISKGIESIYLFSYQFRYEEIIPSKEGQREKLKKGDFLDILEVENLLNSDSRLKNLGRKTYMTKDITGDIRKAMCISYQVIHGSPNIEPVSKEGKGENIDAMI